MRAAVVVLTIVVTIVSISALYEVETSVSDGNCNIAVLPVQGAILPFYGLAEFDMVITPETGLGIGAGAFGTPKIMLLTAASLRNIGGNDDNDYSIQSPAYCSPCTRAIYDTDYCELDEKGGCIRVNFPMEMVLDRMQVVYDARIPRAYWEVRDEKVYM